VDIEPWIDEPVALTAEVGFKVLEHHTADPLAERHAACGTALGADAGVECGGELIEASKVSTRDFLAVN